MEHYKVICYMRIPIETAEPMTYEEAVKEKENDEFMQPENIYKIEVIEK